ncbi:MAG: hypothetical protein J5J00_15145 [Deltaproteobacteria bacterium]|nr:hypothetical protein [Deltaproteobacteria bacterium]
MKHYPLLDFKRLSGLSDGAIVWLLSSGKLPCTLGKQGELLIDCDDLNVKAIISAISKRNARTLDQHFALVEERFSAVMGEQMEELIELVIQRLHS